MIRRTRKPVSRQTRRFESRSKNEDMTPYLSDADFAKIKDILVDNGGEESNHSDIVFIRKAAKNLGYKDARKLRVSDWIGKHGCSSEDVNNFINWLKNNKKEESKQSRRFESRGIRRRFNEGYSISFDEIYDNLEEEEGRGVADDLASDYFHEDVLNAISNVPCKRDQTLYWMVTDILKGNFKYAYEDLFEEVDLDHPTSICNRNDDNPSFYVNDDGSVEYSWGLSYETVAIKPADVASEDGSLENNKSIISIAKELSQMPEGQKLSDDDCFEITKKHYPKADDTAISYCFMPIAISNTGCGHDFDDTLESLIYELTGDPFYSLLDMVILGL